MHKIDVLRTPAVIAVEHDKQTKKLEEHCDVSVQLLNDFSNFSLTYRCYIQPEVKNWLNENKIKHKLLTEDEPCIVDTVRIFQKLYIEFENDEDALLFKLTWL